MTAGRFTAFMAPLLAAGLAATVAQAQTPPAVGVSGETAPSAQSDVNGAAFVVDPSRPEGGFIVGTGGLGGLELYSPAGARVGAHEAGEVVGVDVRYGVSLGGAPSTVIAAIDGAANQMRFFVPDAAGLREVTAAPVGVDMSAESLCLFRSPKDSNLYAFALGGGGEIEQHLIHDDGAGKLAGQLVRKLHLASEVSYCAADDATGDIYFAEQGVGVWRFDADPEAETVPTLIDAARLGRVTEEVGGVALYDGGPGAHYLVVSNASNNDFHLYNRDDDNRYVGSFTLADANGVDGVQAAGGLWASSFKDVLIAADDENDGDLNYKLVAFAPIAAALNLPVGAPQDPRILPASSVPTVQPVVETAPVSRMGDAADDPAIWVNPADPALSVIIGTDKQTGLYVYDLDGKVLQLAADGKMNNVDLRDGFKLGGRTVSIVAASNRTTDSIAIYAVDPATRTLVNVADGVQATGLTDPYGMCMYKNRRGKTYVFLGDSDGRKQQWELIATKEGKVRIKLVREMRFDTQIEGCVADDEAQVLYVAEEDIGLWRLDAEPKGGSAKTSVVTVAANSALKDDLEGIGLYDLGGGEGYLVLSSQGNNTYAVFRREGANDYLGSFAVVANGAKGIDGSSETDGLDVTSRSLGPAFPHGALIVQDGRNISPPQPQNFKYVRWEDIAAQLKLDQR